MLVSSEVTKNKTSKAGGQHVQQSVQVSRFAAVCCSRLILADWDGFVEWHWKGSLVMS